MKKEMKMMNMTMNKNKIITLKEIERLKMQKILNK